MSLYDKKTKGIYYTPKIIVDYILEELLINHDIIKNPEPKILDLSCGCGNFLLEAFDILYKLIKTNLKAINEKYGEHYIDNISTHIITKCLKNEKSYLLNSVNIKSGFLSSVMPTLHALINRSNGLPFRSVTFFMSEVPTILST